MLIDKDSAGLFAQVIPALLVILALEDRLSPSKIVRRKWRRRLRGWRELGVIWNLVSLGLCLFIAVTGTKAVVTTWVITAGVAFLLIVLMALFAGMFGREDDEAVQPHWSHSSSNR
ncbi:hypothetical protein AAIH25_15190 [Arthrobacter crystallopoietes]|uniref:hypothetical protein n=1 Tax=Crystallibacter crystallopoietes TaxID=37928 RepID=UPI003D1B7A69